MKGRAVSSLEAAGSAERSVTSLVAWTVTIGLTAVVGALGVSGFGGRTRPVDFIWLPIPLLYAVLGSIIVSRTGGNRVGWLLIVIGFAIALEPSNGKLRLDEPPASLTPGMFLALLGDQVSWMFWIFPLFFLLYVFPTGRLLSRRWLWVPILQVGMFLILTSLIALGSEIGPFSGAWTVPNPFGFIGSGVVESPGFLVPWSVGLAALTGGAVWSIVMRYRRAGDVERAQLKWVMFAVGLFGVGYAFLLATAGWSDESFLPVVALVVPVGGIPVAIFIAILRYRLYEIDVIISRSLTYGVLAAFIGVVYVGIVVGVGALFEADGSNVGLSVAATAVVAMAFQPVRVRVERLANRLVYGERATPYEVLAQFSRGSAEESDEELLARIPRLIVDGTGASAATLWIRQGDRFQVASTWPESPNTPILPAAEVFSDLTADYSMPVFHGGELLGGISLTKGRGDTVTPTEEELLSNLAGGMGLALRNTQLTSQLRQQVKDLKRSRDRIVSAADQARRSLEHDLDSGPQQHLVAVKVRLSATRILAEKAGAEKTAALLADIESQAGEAIQAVRDFAGGIYPPLLGAEGLGVALGHQVRRAALPVSVHAEGIGRYPRDVESAVYFSVLEALQNTAKYAGATSADVTLSEENGDLVFTVRDDGLGFDTSQISAGAGLNGIADRIDTVGGSWSITSSPGGGTVLIGSVPVREPVLA